MAAFTVPEIIEIAELSVALSVADTLKGKLYSPRLAPNLPMKIYIEKECVKWAYNQSPSYSDIQFTANYLYDLCGIYAIRARNIINGGGGGVPITPVTPNPPTDCNGVEYITSVDFEADGTTVINSDWNNKQIKIFWNNIPKFIKEGTDWVYVFGGGFQIIIPGFDASPGGPNEDVELYVFVGCFTPGSIVPSIPLPINEYIIYRAGTGDPFVFTWSAYYINKYGVWGGEVSVDYGDGNFIATAIKGVADNVSNPTSYTFEGQGDNRFKLTFF